MSRRPSSSLADLQSAFATAVMRPLGAGDLMHHENRATANTLVKPNSRLSSSDRLQIYNQQYWWRLLGSFGEDFRGLRAVFGQRRFDKLATAYLHHCGSTSWNLRDLGSRLPGYLLQHPQLTAPFTDFAHEMALIEWARITAFDGEAKPLLDTQKFSRLAPDKMTLSLQPSITLLQLHHPADHLLKRLTHSEANTASNAMSMSTAASESRKTRDLRLHSKPLPQPIHLVVHRLDLLVYYKRLEPEAFHLLTALRDGHPLEAACEHAFATSTQSPEDITSNVRTWFSAWTTFGWLCRR